MDPLIEKFLAEKSELTRIMSLLKSTMVAYKEAENNLSISMIMNDVTHVHIKEEQITLNRSSADHGIRVYKWKMIYDDDQIDSQDVLMKESLEYLRLKQMKEDLQAQRKNLEQTIKEKVNAICQQCTERSLLRKDTLTLDVWPECNRVAIIRHRQRDQATC